MPSSTHLTHWLASPVGQQVLAAEHALLQHRWLPQLRGEPCYQLGEWGGEQLADVFAGRPQIHPLLLDEILPFKTAELPNILLPHSLEWFADPSTALPEISRVLSPRGRLLILNFTTFGPWHWQRGVPDGGHWQRMSTWLMQLESVGLYLKQVNHYLHAPPVLSKPGLGTLCRPFNHLAGRLFPGGCLLMVSKQEPSVTPLRWRVSPSRFWRPALLPAPSTRTTV